LEHEVDPAVAEKFTGDWTVELFLGELTLIPAKADETIIAKKHTNSGTRFCMQEAPI
jgi:hypothetical protein